MASYDHIMRIVIRKPVSLQDCYNALKKLNEAKYRLDTLQMGAMQGAISPMIFDCQMAIIDDLIHQATKLAGFNSPDDMKYFIENF